MNLVRTLTIYLLVILSFTYSGCNSSENVIQNSQTTGENNFDDREYNEPFRPQFHFSPQKGWIGDPNGTLKYRDEYHLLWWGHATSKDLVYWTEQPYPMKGGDGSFTYYTGSVVVDTANVTNFGVLDSTAMIAVYTMHHNNNSETPGIEEQAISISTDYRNFNYWEENPVIKSNREHFRDPYVFWDNENNRWVMVITAPAEHKIEIYTSENITDWEYQSSFGPLGGQKEMWEVPELIKLPLDDNGAYKWVMICGMGPNKAQFWVGDFDGEKFIPDKKTNQFLKDGIGLKGEVFENFENILSESWKVEGGFITQGDSSNYLKSYLGNSLAYSGTKNYNNTGKLISPTFLIEKRHVNFLIANGNNSNLTSLKIFIEGELVKEIHGQVSNNLMWRGLDVSKWIDKEGHIEIIDNDTSKNAWIAVDHIMFSDKLRDINREHAYWIDWGEDFYAISTYRDFDDKNTDQDIWIGWMGNWTYVREAPTPWGSTAESIPRKIKLVETDQGYNIIQKPIDSFKKLRKDSVVISEMNIDKKILLSEIQPQKNTYELKAKFRIEEGSTNDFGLNLAVGDENKVTIGYDARTANIYLDRTKIANNDFHPEFSTISKAPYMLENNEIEFHVFVDQLSIEVFVNQGERSLTSLMFPNPTDLGIEVFSEGGVSTLEKLTFWPLKSIWE